MKYEPRKLPASITPEKAEEIFIDRYANLIVQLLDHLHDQKPKQPIGENKMEDKKHA